MKKLNFKIRFTIDDNGRASFQIRQMEEKWRNKDENNELVFVASNGFKIFSYDYPDFDSEGCFNFIYLRGCDRSKDSIISYVDFGTKKAAKKFLNKFKVALKQLIKKGYQKY